MLFSGRGRWALLTDLCWKRTRAVCAAEGLAFIFLITRFCTLSRKFLLKIVYSSFSSPDARKCRFNPNRVYFKGTQKPRARVQGVWWHAAQGRKAWVFSYPPSNFVFKAWKTNSSVGSASAGCSTEKAREGGGSKGLDVGREPKPEPRGHPTRQVFSGQTAPMHPEGSLGEFQVLRRAVWFSLRSLPIMHCCVSLSSHPAITTEGRGWMLAGSGSQEPFTGPGRGHLCEPHPARPKQCWEEPSPPLSGDFALLPALHPTESPDESAFR